MDKNQENKCSMFYTVETTCEKYQHIWSSNVPFSRAFELYTAGLNTISILRDQQIGINTTPAAEKNRKKSHVIDLSIFAVNRIMSFANAEGDLSLSERMASTLVELKKARSGQVSGLVNFIIAQSRLLGDQAEIYSLPDREIRRIETALAEFVSLINVPKMVLAESRQISGSLDDHIRQADELLKKRLDLDIEVFKTSNPALYNDYMSARKVVPVVSSALAVRGDIAELSSGDPVLGSTLRFTPQAGGAVLEKRARSDSFRVASMPEGDYSVSITRPGYKPLVMSVRIIKGETAYLDIELEKE